MLNQVIDFLSGCNITVHVKSGVSGFLPHVKIAYGQLWIDPVNDEAIGSLLHDAGHLAVIPSLFRAEATGNVDPYIAKCFESYMIDHPNAFGEPEDSIARGLMQSSEAEAIAWSYAAAHHLGLDTRLPFLEGFEGHGMEVHQRLVKGHHCGINGMHAAGMTRIKNCRRDLSQCYPNMIRWTQL